MDRPRVLRLSSAHKYSVNAYAVRPLKWRLRRPRTLKIWILLTFLGFLCIVINYHRPWFTGLETNERDSATENWLQRFVGDHKFAGDVQSALGDERTKKLAYKISRQLDQFCRAPVVENFEKPPLYVVTTTYRRPEQLAELTRLAQTLMQVQNIYWLLCEDATKKSTLVSNLLKRWRIRSRHFISGPKTSNYHGWAENMIGSVDCRNKALKWIRENADDGVFYFADDDNAYDLELFEEMRYTNKVSMWPVGLVTWLHLSTPIVKNGKIDGFYDGYILDRKFPIDMANFAVSVKFLKERPDARVPYGSEEDKFLKSLNPFEPEEIELKADNCTKILVWHTQAKDYRPAPPLDTNKYANTNLVELYQMMV